MHRFPTAAFMGIIIDPRSGYGKEQVICTAAGMTDVTRDERVQGD